MRQASDIGRDHDFAEVIHRLVDVEPRTVGRDFEHLPIRILEVNAVEVTAVVGTTHPHAVPGQPPLPLQQRIAVRGAKRDVMHAANTPCPPGSVRPLKVGNQRAGRAALLAEIEVVRGRQIEIDRLLDQLKAQQIAIKRQRSRGVARNKRGVVKPLGDE